MGHTPGPWWAKNGIIHARKGDRCCHVAEVRELKPEDGDHNANAYFIAASPELKRELVAAHKIIRNALQIMTIEQKTEWGRLNARDNVDGEGITRANEREAVIAKAEGTVR